MKSRWSDLNRRPAVYITVDLASKELGITFPRADYLIRRHKVPVIQIGHTRLVHRNDLQKLRTARQES